ncbi:hypothetical protein ACQP25_06825 [Microtetraspora malaysiensis]|uniref:hypothetical protein n=1 Tax=Microtetraspora malaysiensis TaxID=161358 RepID=UPI003D8C9E4E
MALRRISAQEAVIGLMSFAFIEIRTMGYRRGPTLQEWPDGPEDYHEQIRMIADICHNLPGDLRPGSKRRRERKAIERLRFFLRGSNDPAAQWVRTRLDVLGYDYRPLLGSK